MPTDFQHAILFTGHMIDAPGRATPRFPASAEPAVRAAMRNALETILASGATPALGMAGGASGGDILFHELCFELGVATRLYLALPVEDCCRASVAPAGAGWVHRFNSLVDRLGAERLGADSIHILADSPGAELSVWSRTNLWMLDEAIAAAPKRTLLALWDGKSGDGPGGTEHLVTTASSLGIEVFPPLPIPSF